MPCHTIPYHTIPYHREGILYDLALVMCNETLFPVAKMQTMLAELNPKVKRKLIILDCRVCQGRPST